MSDLVKTLVEPFLRECDTYLGKGYSAVLHGSVVRGEYLEGWSDVNLLLVLEAATPDVLAALSMPFATWARSRQPPPLLLTRSEWRRAADVFPVEITDIRATYRVLRGDDPIADVVVRPADLRSALERDLRGRLLRLRQGYVALVGDPGALAAMARGTAPSVIVLLRAALVLAGAQVPPARADVASAAGLVIGFPPADLVAILAHLADGEWRCTPECFAGYLAAVESTVRYVDHLSPGDHP
ncbi:MAG TPA: nucleotidyltransferase domain-containing protein [Gemmatimonadales bacterium]|nr:nucleotidyltransferase domain-containing protein [Gemmatimonadales bacterium]